MTPSPSPSASERLSDEIPADFIDCDKLFPAHGNLKSKQNDLEVQRWFSKSAFTVATVGFLSKVYLKGIDYVFFSHRSNIKLILNTDKISRSQQCCFLQSRDINQCNREKAR